ncbi:putative nucleotidyltransferase substrate binding domain-containing protein [Candidatus Albibeggiatoa sp. nov. BB20]|uniref:putative nucleotidyltransferase substrate binding domain-containing protein n=1 Tax=Candidatus Albibeggiatoa sp. nov. BB20 TaxID=3162723 RepID=UPI00336597F8
MSVLEQKAFIGAIAPFDKLRPTELEAVAEAMDIGYFKQGDVLVKRFSSPEYLYIIIKGVVQEIDNDGVASVHVSQDMIDAMALIDGESKKEFVVEEELICYLLPKELFTTLLDNNKEFQKFYYQNISERLDSLIEQRYSKELSSFMVAKIKEAYVRPPIAVNADDSIYDAVAQMKQHKITSILIKRGDEIGIVSDTDIREQVVLQRKSIDSPVGDIATYNLIGMTTEDFLFNALLTMTRHRIKRLVIYENNEVMGVLDQMELLSFFSNHSHLISVQIERANTTEQLQKACESLVHMVQSLQAKGVKVRYIAQLINELNTNVFEKLYQLIAPPELIENSCLMVMGSEGRAEQVLKTDQDNAIILRDGFQFDGLEAITQQFTETLISFGYPSCPGDIMVNNSYWCKPLSEFKEEIHQWISEPAENSMMNLAIFYDACAVAGDEDLLREAKGYLFEKLQDNKAFFTHFAKPTLSFETPLGFFANFIVEKSHHKNQLDLKKGGIFPIVQGVRSLALEHRLTMTNTIERIKTLQQLDVFEKKVSVELIEALAFLSTLRLQTGLSKLEHNEELDNYIAPNQLNKLERDLLKDSFKIVNEFKKFITYHFKLNMV